MKNYFICAAKAKKSAFMWALIFIFAVGFSSDVSAQKRKAKTAAKTVSAAKIKKSGTAAKNLSLPKVVQIDADGLKNLLKREPNDAAKPLLVNFWATWCDPCREEFPDLVKLNAEYKNKIDFITVSIDDLAEIDRDVPKFLVEMKAEMPAYLLKSQDEEAAIAAVAGDWKGAMPFTILFDNKGEIVYSRQGKVESQILRREINRILPGENVQMNGRRRK